MSQYFNVEVSSAKLLEESKSDLLNFSRIY